MLRLELKGADNSLRVRQIRVLGETGESLSVGRIPSAVTIHQKLCESETLKVFRLITSQVCTYYSPAIRCVDLIGSQLDSFFMLCSLFLLNVVHHSAG